MKEAKTLLHAIDTKAFIMQSQSNKDLTHRTLIQMSWTSFGSALQVVLQIVVLAILARCLTPADFGLFSAALIVVSFLQVFGELGIGSAIVQIQDLTEYHLKTAYTISLGSGLLFMTIVILSAPFIETAFRIKGLSPIVQALSLLFPVQAFSRVGQYLLQRHMRFDAVTRVTVVSQVIGYALVVTVFAYLEFGVWALVYASLSQALLQTGLIIYYQKYPKIFAIDRQAFKNLIHFGAGLTLGRILNQVALKGDYVVVGRFLGADQLGIYTRAYHLMEAPSGLFSDVAKNVLFAATSRIQDEHSRMASAYRRTIALVAMLVMPIATLVVLLSPEIVNVVLGQKWHDVILPLQILAAGIFLRTSYKVSDVIVTAKGAVYRKAFRDLVYCLIVIAGAFLGQLFYQLPGVAGGVLVALSINFLLMTQLGLSVTGLNIKEFAVAHVPALLLSLVVFLSAWPTAMLLRRLSYSNLTTLLACSLVPMIALLIVVSASRSAILGKDGKWILGNIKKSYLRKTKSAVN